jgi:hypothetical protein
MGHSYAEMYFPGEETFIQRYARYQQACATEISDIIEKNPIRNEEIELGDKLELYEPLLGISKIRFENTGEFHQIRKLFDPGAQYYSMDMWVLAFQNIFTVRGKRTITQPRDDLKNHTETLHLVRVDSQRKCLDWNPSWLDIRYFSKK